jgi:hypothetical protein
MEAQNKTTNTVQSILSGIGVTVLYLLLGTILDYGLTQILSQYFLLDCSEDCYFRYFNTLFIAVVLLSVAGGIQAGMRAHKRSAEKR